MLTLEGKVAVITGERSQRTKSRKQSRTGFINPGNRGLSVRFRTSMAWRRTLLKTTVVSGTLLSFGTKRLRFRLIGKSLAVRNLSVIVSPGYLANPCGIAVGVGGRTRDGSSGSRSSLRVA